MASGALADWRSDADYRALLGCDAELFAWEWLRRDPAYRQAASAGPDGEALRFGLHRFEDPDLPACQAHPIWCAGYDPAALSAIAEPDSGPDAFALARVASLASLAVDASGEHLLLSDGCHALRIDIAAGTIRQGPVRLNWQIAGLETALPPVATLRRLAILYRSGRFPHSSHPTPARAWRWLLLLRVRDALADGASQREIAAALFGNAVAGPRWRVDASAYRLRVQRLVQSTRRMAGQGPRAWLRPPVDRLH